MVMTVEKLREIGKARKTLKVDVEEKVAVLRRELWAEFEERYDRAIWEALKGGLSISAIAKAVDNANRNYIYEVKRKFTEIDGPLSAFTNEPKAPMFEYLRMVDRIRSEGYYIAEVRYLPTGEKWNVRGFFNSFDLFDYATEDKAMACGMVERREDRTFTEIPEDVQEELRQVTGHKQIWDKYR